MVVKIISILLVFSCIQNIRAAPLNVTISPHYIRVGTESNNVTFKCVADVDLTRCQFKWWDSYGRTGPLLELSEGAQTEAHSAHLTDEITGYRYSGHGLETGECGVTLEIKGEKRWVVACRVEAWRGGWKYAWAQVHASAKDKSLVHIFTTPREVVVLPGKRTSIQVDTNEPLSRCNFLLPGVTDKISFEEKAKTTASTNRTFSYQGAGLQNGECGLALENATSANNGPALLWMTNTAGDSDYSRYVTLIVAHPPRTPVLRIEWLGPEIKATCEFHGNRPSANITWFIDDDVISRVTADETKTDPQDAWRWPWMHSSTTQTLWFEVKPSHHGKIVKCQVSHVALRKPLVASERIVLTAVPDYLPTPVPRTNPAKSVEFVGPCKECPNECPKHDELYEQKQRESRAAKAIKELAQEKANLTLEAAKSSVKLNEARAREFEALAIAAELSIEKAKYNVKVEEAKAQNAEEELDFQRKRRSLGYRLPKSLRNGPRPVGAR